MLAELFAFVDRWAPLGVLFAQPVVLAVIWCLKKTFVLSQDYQRDKSDMEDLVVHVERRMDETQTRLECMPGADAVQELLVSLTRLEGSVRAMDERVSGMLSNLNLLMRVHTGDGK